MGVFLTTKWPIPYVVMGPWMRYLITNALLLSATPPVHRLVSGHRCSQISLNLSSDHYNSKILHVSTSHMEPRTCSIITHFAWPRIQPLAALRRAFAACDCGIPLRPNAYGYYIYNILIHADICIHIGLMDIQSVTRRELDMRICVPLLCVARVWMLYSLTLQNIYTHKHELYPRQRTNLNWY